MNLYIIWQTKNTEYDTYDSAVVVAESEEEAVQIHPGYEAGYEAGYEDWNEKTWRQEQGNYGTWVKSPEDVQVRYLGKAEPNLQKNHVVLASFNAG